ncbi:MAG: AAA family ATPase [Verrucomicrobiota bacterium]|jgi:predicted AAA+ superfamily ATPase
MIRRAIHDELLKRLMEKRRFLQVLAGPRQAGKTTLARQVMAASQMPAHYASADEPALRGDRTWLEQQWDIARLKAGEGKSGALLVLDEIQKITDWPNVVKLLWDADTHSGVPLKVVLLGCAPLLIQSGLTDSLAGRFEVISVPHWSLTEMRQAFGWTLELYIFYGAYPGAAGLIEEPERWRRYILDSLIETTISRDILSLNRVDKPALLRRVFYLGCAYSGQILSYQKMIGQLADAGNTTTLAHYLELLQGAGMLAGLAKYSRGRARQRGSSPKLQALNTALMSAQDHRSLAEARRDGDYWGRLVESSIGAHLFNSSFGANISLTYWRERNQEVDFILEKGKTTVAIEVKSGGRRESLPGMEAFARQFKPRRQLLVGGQGIALEEFLSQPAAHWLT